MSTPNEHTPPHFDQGRHIEVAGVELAFRRVTVDDNTPTGAQIAIAAGFVPLQQVTVLQVLPTGALEDVRPDEVVDLRERSGRFIVAESDASYRMTIDGQRVDWPARKISGAIIRQLGRVPDSKAIYYEQQDQPDQLIQNDTILDLSATGVEAFYGRTATWNLNVQGVRLELHMPTVLVRDALVQAGFNPDQGWHIFLKVVGQPKRPVDLTSVIDLREPGIEKLRLTPKDVNNGEGSRIVRKEFALLEADEDFLDQHFAHWETLVQGGRRWLLIYAYPTPPGYSVRRITLALEVPPNYPGAQIDMFYVLPHLSLISGAPLPNTEAREVIEGSEYQRWSRHRGAGSEWKANSDNVITHLALVESALVKETQQ
ncbi:multiubiquitin domain-containing protein [Cupriavidus pauculus]|uniref:multiubiquitin domain-containing protein n=1 Tax=Cupriavidus pauculus TaxID=82633 RepID=UPI0007814287|nr:multiubiquitin domain-containing protein [Cupriavidus pauculus]